MSALPWIRCAISVMIMWGKMTMHVKYLLNRLNRRINHKGGIAERLVGKYFPGALKLSYLTNLPLVRPLTAVISLTNRCNSRCVYCNSWKSVGNDAPLGEWLEIINQLSELGITELIFSGGEPLLAASLEAIIKAGNDAGIFTHVISNGILLTTDRMQTLIKSGVKGITISVDSLEEQEYSATRGIPFANASQALDVLFDYKKRYPDYYAGINVVITAKNLSAYQKLINTASANGVYVSFQSYSCHPDFILEELMPSSENESMFSTAIEHIKEAKNSGKLIASSPDYLNGILPFMKSRSLPDGFKCLAGYLGVNIDSKLNVMACWNMPPVGNLREASLDDIWNSDRFLDARSRMRNLECQKCWILCHTDVESMTRRRSRKRV